VQTGLGKLNAFPARGTLFSDPAYLGQLLEKVTAELGLPAPVVEMGGAGGGGGSAAGAAPAADDDERVRRAVAHVHVAAAPNAEGMLEKRSSGIFGSRWQSRFFAIRGQSFKHAKTEEAFAKSSTEVCDLRKVRGECTRSDRVLTLVVDGEKAPVQLRAESAERAQQWEAALREAVGACQAQRKASVMQSADFARKGSSTGKLRAPSSGSEAIGGAGIGDAAPAPPAAASAEGSAGGSGAAAAATSAPKEAGSLPERVAALALSVLGEAGTGGLALQIQAVEEALLGAKQTGALLARVAALEKTLEGYSEVS
jgi:hypothetical protein